MIFQIINAHRHNRMKICTFLVRGCTQSEFHSENMADIIDIENVSTLLYVLCVPEVHPSYLCRRYFQFIMQPRKILISCMGRGAYLTKT